MKRLTRLLAVCMLVTPAALLADDGITDSAGTETTEGADAPKASGVRIGSGAAGAAGSAYLIGTGILGQYRANRADTRAVQRVTRQLGQQLPSSVSDTALVEAQNVVLSSSAPARGARLRTAAGLLLAPVAIGEAGRYVREGIEDPSKANVIVAGEVVTSTALGGVVGELFLAAKNRKGEKITGSGAVIGFGLAGLGYLGQGALAEYAPEFLDLGFNVGFSGHLTQGTMTYQVDGADAAGQRASSFVTGQYRD